MDERIYNSKAECCGCGACAILCPKSAIKMERDEEGFLYPLINESACVHCGICALNCAFSKRIPSQDFRPQSFVVRHNDDAARMNSRSGAVFVCCADYIIKKGGSVYGCVMNGFAAEHVRAVSMDDIDGMRRSKYIQSDSTHIYKKIEEDLKAGMPVLFSGTGCQVDAVRQYLERKRIDEENFFAMDIVCHGVPSPMLFLEFIGYLEKKYKGKISCFEFRDKSICGWDDHIESFIVNGVKYPSTKWRELFYTNAISRPSCGNCKYASLNRAGDITFADAWGVKEAAPEMHDNRGVSAVFVNTEKGCQLFDAIKKECMVKEVPLSLLLQHNMRAPSSPNVNRAVLWEIYKKNGIEGLVNVYGKQPFRKRFLKKIKYILRKVYYGKKMFLPGFYPLNH